jgi:type I restriction enzyme S subunit
MTTMTRLKRVAVLRAGGTPTVDDPKMWSDGGLPWISIGDMTHAAKVTATERRVSDAGISSKRLPVGDVGTTLFAMYASVGALAELGTRATWNQAILGIEALPGLAEGPFLHYWLEHIRPALGALTRSNTQDNLNAEQVGNFPFPATSTTRQRAIADFLDAETARIDALIAKKRRLIELLDERFGVLADRVVWDELIDGVPLMRRTAPGRPIMYGIVLPGPDVPEGVPIVKGGDVAASRLDPVQLNRTTREIEMPYARARLARGDLVFAIRGGIGAVEVVPVALAGANITQDVARVAPADDIDSSWLKLALATSSVRRQVEARTTGATIKGLNIWELKRVLIPSSDRRRQVEDLSNLAPVADRQHRLTRGLQTQIDLLIEHRQALITAAVTGELEIPGAAA